MMTENINCKVVRVISFSDEAQLVGSKKERVEKFGSAFNFANSYRRLFLTGIYSKKAAEILNAVLNGPYIFRNNLEKNNRSKNYYGKIAGNVGGLFAKCDAEITFNYGNEVGILCHKEYAIEKTIKVPRYDSELVEVILDKMGNELKKFWKSVDGVTSDTDNRIINFYNTDKNEFDKMTITYSEYRVLYETLKGRCKDKIIKKYGKINFDNIIGKKIDDQFVISATEMLQNEINNKIKEKEEMLITLQQKHEENWRKLKETYNDNVKNTKDEFDKAIKELELQIYEMTGLTNNSRNENFATF